MLDSGDADGAASALVEILRDEHPSADGTTTPGRIRLIHVRRPMNKACTWFIGAEIYRDPSLIDLRSP